MKVKRQRANLSESGMPPRSNPWGDPKTRRFVGRIRFVPILLIYFGVALTGAKLVNAQSESPFYIFEDFEDLEDGEYLKVVPGQSTWTVNSGPGGEDLAKIMNGDLIRDLRIEENGNTGYMEHRHLVPTNLSLRTQARMLEELGNPPVITLIARLRGSLGNHFHNDPDEFIFFDLWSNGEVRAQQNAAARQRSARTDLRPLDEDVVLQLDAIGEDVGIWVWPAGEPRPEEPIIQYTAEDDPTVLPGGVGFGVFYSKAAFRYVVASDQPIEDRSGDFNFDFQLDATDIDLLTAEIQSPDPRPWFDLNDDGEVSMEDRNVWVESEDIANTFFGDTDLNGEVNFGDFVALSTNFGQPGGWAQGNFDGLGDVEFGDFVLLSSNFGNTRKLAAQSVPEPNASVLALACCLYLGVRRTRLTKVR